MSKCANCKNALFIGYVSEYAAYVCSKTLHIKENCTMHQNGTPRDASLELPNRIVLSEIQCGTGKPLLEQAMIDGYIW